MKTIIKLASLTLCFCAFNTNLSAQTAQAGTTAIIPKARPVTETVTDAPQGKELVLTVKNGCEKSIAVFAGPKEDIRDPKLNLYGGMSSNKVYVRPNDVVCLMTSDKKPSACTVVKPGMTSVEVNSSGNAIAGR